MYYPNLTRELKQIIAQKFPEAERYKNMYLDVDYIDNHFQMACYLLWMLDELQKFEPDDVAKRGRWIGYVQARMEAMGLITNTKNRELTRKDVQGNANL